MVVAIGAWKWKEYLTEARGKLTPELREKLTARGYLEFYLDSFLDLYQNHSDILRFNHYLNSYVEKERVTAEQMRPYRDVIEEIVHGFYRVFRGSADGTLRPDVSLIQTKTNTRGIYVSSGVTLIVTDSSSSGT